MVSGQRSRQLPLTWMPSRKSRMQLLTPEVSYYELFIWYDWFHWVFLFIYYIFIYVLYGYNEYVCAYIYASLFDSVFNDRWFKGFQSIHITIVVFWKECTNTEVRKFLILVWRWKRSGNVSETLYIGFLNVYCRLVRKYFG